jgi:hypothetical protein
VTVSHSAHGRLTAYVSWNGASEVARYRVLEGSSPSTLAASAQQVERSGFQTAITLTGSPRYVAVQALSSSGAILRTSQTSKV